MITAQEIRKAAAIIRGGGLVAFPTETVYGLGADAFNKNAVARVFEVKARPCFDPLIVHVASVVAVEGLAASIDRNAMRLMERFWPGPLTLVLKKSPVVPEIVTAGLPTIAVRMPAHPVALELLREAGTPIAAPSANPFGYLSPTTAAHVKEQLGERVDLILDGGACRIGIESTVVELTGKTVRLLRPGGLPVEEIEQVIGRVESATHDPARPHSPGQLPQHYSPRTPVRIIPAGERLRAVEGRVGLLAFRTHQEDRRFARVETLSLQGDLREAAANLFSCLHRLDEADLDLLYAEAVPEEGLGRAIMDRLRRASAKATRPPGANKRP